ncbi:MAG TPA: DUF2231 domain-containing protein [Dermatophilaceae bacterium]|nr:DUF2231 domain-containing protein [Dermatophilaceae bacterium]
MFDTVIGLPVHALVVHGVVVLLPLMCLATVAVAFLPRLRPLAWWVVVANAGVAAMTLVARQSGEALFARLQQPSVAINHVSLGRNLIWFALGLFVASVLVAVARRGTRRTPAAVLSLAAAALALYWAIRTGHTGSQAVWAQVVKNTKAP